VATESAALDLGHAVALLAAAVIAVPLFRKLGLGAVLGYLCAGLLIGPFGLALFRDPQAILHVAELGVVLFLFLIGLEMRPGKLWALRREIFGLGVRAGAGVRRAAVRGRLAFGWPPAVAVIGAMGFVLSSTAVIMKMLDEQGETATPAGQRAVSILLLEDLTIIPLLALIALFLTRAGHGRGGCATGVDVRAGRARRRRRAGGGRTLGPESPCSGSSPHSGGRDVMTAAALLVVLGAALFMQWAACRWPWAPSSPACCCRNRRSAHQLEADIEPFAASCSGCSSFRSACSLDLGGRRRRVGACRRPVSRRYGSSRRSPSYGVAAAFRADHRESVQRAALSRRAGSSRSCCTPRRGGRGIRCPRGRGDVCDRPSFRWPASPRFVVLLLRAADCRSRQRHSTASTSACLSGRVLIIGFRPVRARCEPAAADARRGRVDHRLRRGPDPRGRQLRLQGLLGDGSRLDVLRASGAAVARTRSSSAPTRPRPVAGSSPSRSTSFRSPSCTCGRSTAVTAAAHRRGSRLPAARDLRVCDGFASRC